MIFIYFKGLMTKSAFLIKKQYFHRKLLYPFKGTCALQLPKKGFSMFYNPISIHLWKFLSYFYPHFSFIDMCLFLALSELLENQSQQSWVCFPAQDPLHIFSDLPSRASGSSLSSQAVNSAFCTLTLLSGGKMERLIMWTMWQTEKSAASELQQRIASAVCCLIFHAIKHMKPN